MKYTNKVTKISIIIPVKNGGRLLEQVLSKIYSQNIQPNEVIIIDSGSTDNTLAILKRFPIELYKIDPREYGHGKTRNLAATKASGKYLVFMNQDTIPTNNSWLSNLILSLKPENVAGVYGKQIPWPDENHMEKHFYSRTYGNRKIRWNKHLYSKDVVIFSTANCAIKREIFKKYAFRNEIYMCEDREWAHRILDKGYSIVYEPKSSVIHSHHYDFWQMFTRVFDFGIAFNFIYKKYNRKMSIKNSLHYLISEFKYLRKNNCLYLLPKALFYDFGKYIALILGENSNLLPKPLLPVLSNYYHKRK